MSLKEMVTHYERQLILAALATSAGHQRRAAESLGLLPTTLHEKMKRLGIPTATAAIPLEESVGESIGTP
jgi:DNA-binding NtrC family response regulator